MGLYINPRDGSSKEKWLANNSVQFSPKGTSDEYNQFRTEENVPVCLVNNGFFTAGAVAYSIQEYNEFRDTTNDSRAKKWFLVPVAKLTQVCQEDELKRYL